ncbi:MAG: hypothetical protein A07HR67_02239 [uncultured archaeon A07HR67]|nr:MAG: hypothetical protein A07HR67_02239 [uncultured archaeon A07HR67]
MTASTSPDETRLRFRSFLDAQFTVLLVVCLVLAAAGAGLVYTTHVDPGTEPETRTVSSWTVETEYAHSAEVTEPNPVFALGAVLENRETYFANVAPELDVTPRVTYTADEAEGVDVEVRSVLVVRNVGEEGTVYWEQQETVDSTAATGVTPGETVTAPFTLNSTAVDERVAAIESELGASPGETETFVVTDVEVAGTLNGENTTYTRSVEFGFSHEDATYTVADPGVQSDTTEQTVTEPVERTYGPLRSFGGPLVLVVGLLGVAGLSYARYAGLSGIDEAERTYLSFRDDRSEFDEWITRIRLPPETHDRPEAHADTLRDLVDFAIDTDTGVVEDPDTGAFHAVADEYVYTYHPPLAATRGPATDPPSEADADTSQSTAAESTPNTAPDGSEADESAVDGSETDEADTDASLFANGSPDADGSATATDQAVDHGAEAESDDDSDATEQS